MIISRLVSQVVDITVQRTIAVVARIDLQRKTITIIINIVHEVHNKERKRQRETENNRTYNLGED